MTEQKPVFIAFNGEEFKTEEECVKYEKSINGLTDIIPALQKVRKICDSQMKCEGCVFYKSSMEECLFTSNIPASWSLRRIGG